VRDRRADANVPSRPRDTGPSLYKSPFASNSGDAVPEIEIETATLRCARGRQTERFLKEPIPMRDIAATSGSEFATVKDCRTAQLASSDTAFAAASVLWDCAVTTPRSMT
jgi:hypothetical protein